MHDRKALRATLAAFLASLDNERPDIIDFDTLTESLRQLDTVLAAADDTAEQRERLADDYRARIAGMIKAIAAVNRRRDAFDIAALELEQLATLDTDALILYYQRTAARFRDAFPASFAYLSRPDVATADTRRTAGKSVRPTNPPNSH